jgi:NitT/TauT family transport system ATP-binding protein
MTGGQTEGARHAMIAPTVLTLEGLSKSFGSTRVLDGLNLLVHRGEVLSFFGPNGCGKSTLLNILAGIVRQDSGEVAWDSSSPERIGVVFQNYDTSLMPWLTCLDNVAFPLLTNRRMGVQKRRSQALALLEEFDLRLPVDRYPYQMSGGQKQLTCIARALMRQPSLLLLDEPFGSLDFQTRSALHSTIQLIWRRTGITTILVSHEVDEALLLADRLVLLSSSPARILDIYDVAVERPRDHGTLSDPYYVSLRSLVLERFFGGSRS